MRCRGRDQENYAWQDAEKVACLTRPAPARPGAKSLFWQTQGGRVKYRQGWEGEKSGLFEHPAGVFFLAPNMQAIERSSAVPK